MATKSGRTTQANDWFSTEAARMQDDFETFEGMKDLSPEAFEKAVFKAKLGGTNFNEDYLRILYNRHREKNDR
jgi:hypothetical protein